MQVRFVTVDVFTHHQFGGNPLAVVLDAEGLTSSQMQAIAGEFNLAETTFVLPPKDASNTAQVRIFTPRAELPFAGHPNVGTAFVLARDGQVYGRPIEGKSLTFEEVAGLVRMDLMMSGKSTTGARLSSPQPLTIAESIAPEIVAETCNVTVSDVALTHHSPCIASCGVRFIFAELKSLSALAAARPNASAFHTHVPREQATGVHLYVYTKGQTVDVQSRMFAPLYGIPEDPATGGANVALIGLLAHLSPQSEDVISMRIGQGFEMGRPSIMEAKAEKQSGKVVQTMIGGECVEMMRGILNLR